MWYLVMSKATQSADKLLVSLDEHLAWMKRQHESGHVLFSGPTSDHQYGIMVLKAPTLESARETLSTDPFISSGMREYVIYEWEVHQVLGVGQFEFHR